MGEVKSPSATILLAATRYPARCFFAPNPSTDDADKVRLRMRR